MFPFSSGTAPLCWNSEGIDYLGKRLPGDRSQLTRSINTEAILDPFQCTLHYHLVSLEPHGEGQISICQNNANSPNYFQIMHVYFNVVLIHLLKGTLQNSSTLTPQHPLASSPHSLRPVELGVARIQLKNTSLLSKGRKSE